MLEQVSDSKRYKGEIKIIFSKDYIFQRYDTDREKISEMLIAMSRNNRTFESLNESERTLSLACRLDGEIGNGGLSQYFLNSEGVYIEETIKCLQSLNAHEHRKIFDQASTAYLSNEDEETKYKYWSDLTEKYDRIDYNLIYKLLIEFVRNHWNDFE
ncbi:protein of unknown function [Paenibacillus uliginis N3/975]|uniref:DNA mimic protein DMP19 C-terminal domain-containing protein n=1 Tax=Paenibacillus uliginis N3/975 TaxID=1313296 RepID=A0A1X7HJM8_9BACL|nr:DUF4375 domain-containing protein [Paenibacillus uliginis]SMF87802.1 protein of unknown function [Paenibacillus uliginis N3/975]